jgi:dolichol-phosphate mannosyltransferase
VPVFNEEECLPTLHRRLTTVLAQIRGDYEILFVNDGSRDRSLAIIKSLAAQDARVGYSSFSRNFGHEAATTCGLSHARGQAVVLIDADLQDPPEIILEMLDKWRDGYEIVYAQRRSRAGESFLTRATSHLFYRVFRYLAKVEIPVDTGDFRLMDQKVVEAFRNLPERSRFVRGMISWTGFRQTSVLFNRDSRLAGETKYNFLKRLRLAFDAICGMSTAPLRSIGYVGGGIAFLSVFLGLIGIARDLVGAAAGGTWLLASAGFFLAGIQLLSVGLLGEYIGRIYLEVQGRPIYILAESEPPASSALSTIHRAAG